MKSRIPVIVSIGALIIAATFFSWHYFASAPKDQVFAHPAVAHVSVPWNASDIVNSYITYGVAVEIIKNLRKGIITLNDLE